MNMRMGQSQSTCLASAIIKVKKRVRLSGIEPGLHRIGLLIVISLIVSGCAGIPIGVSEKAPLTATALPSKDVFSLSDKAQEAYTQSRWIEAVQLYQQVVEKVPNDADAWFRLGNTYAQQGALERAIHAYETSLINDSRQPKAWFNLSTAYLLNAQAAMRQSFDRMRANDPARALVDARLLELGELLHRRLEEPTPEGVRTGQ